MEGTLKHTLDTLPIWGSKRVDEWMKIKKMLDFA